MDTYSKYDIDVEVTQLQDRFPVECDIQEHSVNNFTGSETIIVVAGFALSGIAGGMVNTIGSDMWGLIKKICSKLRKKQKHRLQKTIIDIAMTLPNKNRKVSFFCTLDENSKEAIMDDFTGGIIKKIEYLQKKLHSQSSISETPSMLKYEFVDGALQEKKQ
jgi:hypothetical protein